MLFNFNIKKIQMDKQWVQKWDNRYSEEAYAFGLNPNEYFKEKIERLKTGNILFPAEGEGRNAIYASKLGWDVSAFDISNEGKKKALQLAEKCDVNIDYQVGELPDLDYQPEQFDAIVLVYAHFPSAIKYSYHHLLDRLLKKDGYIIFEAFGKNHLKYRSENPKVGGPSDIESLFSTQEISEDFGNYKILELEEKVIELNEGIYHQGKGSVVRFFGQKKKN